MGKVIRLFCWHQNLSRRGCLPLPEAIYMSKIMKKFGVKSDFKEIFLKLATNDWSDRAGGIQPPRDKWLKWQNFIPKGLSAPATGLYTCVKSWKKLYKIRFHRDFFETCSKWPKWQEVSVDIKILSPGIVCPWPVAYIHISNHEMMCIKSEVEEILF